MGEESQRMEGEKKAGGAAVCRTQGEIKGASLSIDCTKIGLHLQLSYCCCLFVCLDKSCDLGERTLCLLSIQGTGGAEGGVDRSRKKKRREGRVRGKRITLQQSQLEFPFSVTDGSHEASVSNTGAETVF